MRARRSWLLVAYSLIVPMLFLVGLGIGSVASNAEAHSPGPYYPNVWPNDPPVAFGRVSSPLDTATAKTSMRYYSPWNSVSGSTLDFSWSGIDTSIATWNGTTCSSGLYNGYVWIFTDDISPLAMTGRCLSGSAIVKIAIRYDHTRSNWHTGSSTSVPSGRADLRSVAVHEFGHAGGFGFGATQHWGSSYCSGTGRQTMCATIPNGTSYMRTLEDHDRHTVANAY